MRRGVAAAVSHRRVVRQAEGGARDCGGACGARWAGHGVAPSGRSRAAAEGARTSAASTAA